MGKVIDLSEYVSKKKLSAIKLSKEEIMQAKEDLLFDDYRVCQDEKKVIIKK